MFIHPPPQQGDLFTIKTAEYLLTTGTWGAIAASDMEAGRRFPKGVWETLRLTGFPINHRLRYNKYKQTEIEFCSLCLLVSVSTDIYRYWRTNTHPVITPSRIQEATRDRPQPLLKNSTHEASETRGTLTYFMVRVFLHWLEKFSPFIGSEGIFYSFLLFVFLFLFSLSLIVISLSTPPPSVLLRFFCAPNFNCSAAGYILSVSIFLSFPYFLLGSTLIYLSFTFFFYFSPFCLPPFLYFLMFPLLVLWS
jgi:hypothetical protein